MICTEKRLTTTKSLLENKINLDRKQELISRWEIVNGKLVCQWTTA